MREGSIVHPEGGKPEETEVVPMASLQTAEVVLEGLHQIAVPGGTELLGLAPVQVTLPFQQPQGTGVLPGTCMSFLKGTPMHVLITYAQQN